MECKQPITGQCKGWRRRDRDDCAVCCGVCGTVVGPGRLGSDGCWSELEDGSGSGVSGCSEVGDGDC